MKHIPYTAITLMLSAVLVLSCSKDKAEDETRILGTWFESSTNEDLNRTYRNEYTFKDDNTFTNLSMVIDPASGEILGYHLRQTGNYIAVNDSLAFYDTQYWINDDPENTYVPLDELVEGGEFPGYNHGVDLAFSNNNNTMIFFYRCNTWNYALCIGSRTLKRELPFLNNF